MPEPQKKPFSRRPPMTVRDAATHLRISIREVRSFCHRGLIRYSKALPKKWLLDRDDVETLLERTA